MARGETFPTPIGLAWCAVAGIAGAIGLASFYRGLASGRMGVVAPIAGVLAAAVPVVVGIALEGLPAPLQLAGMLAAVVAIAVVSWSSSRDDEGSVARSVVLATLAGLGFGGFFVLIDQAGGDALFWKLAAARTASITLMTILVLASRTRLDGLRSVAPLVVIAGLLDLGGNAFFLVAAGAGRLDVASVLSSLYPIVTVGLAAVVLKERIGPIHAAGIAIAAVAIVLIAAG